MKSLVTFSLLAAVSSVVGCGSVNSNKEAQLSSLPTQICAKTISVKLSQINVYDPAVHKNDTKFQAARAFF